MFKFRECDFIIAKVGTMTKISVDKALYLSASKRSKSKSVSFAISRHGKCMKFVGRLWKCHGFECRKDNHGLGGGPVYRTKRKMKAGGLGYAFRTFTIRLPFFIIILTEAMLSIP